MIPWRDFRWLLLAFLLLAVALVCIERADGSAATGWHDGTGVNSNSLAAWPATNPPSSMSTNRVVLPGLYEQDTNSFYSNSFTTAGTSVNHRVLFASDDTDSNLLWALYRGKDITNVVGGATNIEYWFNRAVAPSNNPAWGGKIGSPFPLYAPHVVAGGATNYFAADPSLTNQYIWPPGTTNMPWQYPFVPATNRAASIQDAERLDCFFAFVERYEVIPGGASMPQWFFGNDDDSYNLNDAKTRLLAMAPSFVIKPYAAADGTFNAYLSIPRTNWAFFSGSWHSNVFYGTNPVWDGASTQLESVLNLPLAWYTYITTGSVPGWTIGNLGSANVATSTLTNRVPIGEYFKFSPSKRFTLALPGMGHIVTDGWAFVDEWLTNTDHNAAITNQLTIPCNTLLSLPAANGYPSKNWSQSAFTVLHSVSNCVSTNGAALLTNVCLVEFKVVLRGSYATNGTLAVNTDVTLLDTNLASAISSLTVSNGVFTNYDVAAGWHEIDYGWDGVRSNQNALVWQVYPLASYSADFTLSNRWKLSDYVDISKLGIVATTNNPRLSQGETFDPSYNSILPVGSDFQSFQTNFSAPNFTFDSYRYLKAEGYGTNSFPQMNGIHTNTLPSFSTPYAIGYQGQSLYVDLVQDIYTNLPCFGSLGFRGTNAYYSWHDCPVNSYTITSACSGGCVEHHVITVLGTFLVSPGAIASSACGCTSNSFNYVSITAWAGQSGAFIYPEFCSNFACSADLYVLTTNGPTDGGINSFKVPLRGNVIDHGEGFNGSHAFDVSFLGFVNPDHITGTAATNFQYSLVQTPMNCGTCSTVGSVGEPMYLPEYNFVGTNTPVLKQYIGNAGPFSTNFNVAIYANELRWDDLGTGLRFDRTNNIGLWQMIGSAGSPALHPAIALSRFVTNNFGTFTGNDFAGGWAIKSAQGLIKWDGTNGFKFK